MELINATKMIAAYAPGLQPDGRELLVVVVKGSFVLPKNGEEPVLADEQAEMVFADEFTGEPGFSAPKYESDFAPIKPRCDVLLNGSAYAPGGGPVERVDVGLRVGSMSKIFTVVGNRTWRKGLLGISATKPEPFVKMPISYDNAFGGIDKNHPDEKKHRFYLENHAGKGFHSELAAEFIEGAPLPNTEELGQRITSPKGKYRPMAFGPVGRAWQPRPKFAGTYDQNWQDNVFPFLPADFDNQYYQSAPQDQQIDYPRGGEEVEMFNLTPDGRRTFKLPTLEMAVCFFLRNGEKPEAAAPLDTIILEPDLNRFILAWRIALPLKKNMLEMDRVVVGRMSPAWYRAQELGKTYYSSLKVLIEERDSVEA
jgi:hypothetical protein